MLTTYDLSHLSLDEIKRHIAELQQEKQTAGLATDIRKSDQAAHIAEINAALAALKAERLKKEMGF